MFCLLLFSLFKCLFSKYLIVLRHTTVNVIYSAYSRISSGVDSCCVSRQYCFHCMLSIHGLVPSQGGIHGDVAMTSFVLMSLMECRCKGKVKNGYSSGV